MAIFGKTGIDLLQDMLAQVKGGIYILDTKYEKKTKQLLIAYGTVANSEKQPSPYSGISINVRVISDEDLADTTEFETIKIKNFEIKAPQNIAGLFWNIVSELSNELEIRIQKIVKQPANSIFAIKSVNIVNPFTIDSHTASVKIDLIIGDRHYQEELPSYQIFYLGSKGLMNYLFLRIVQYLCMQTFIVNDKVYIEIPARSLTDIIPRFLKTITEVGLISVILDDEEAINLKLMDLQKKVLGFVKKDQNRNGIEKNYFLSEEGNEFFLNGLELTYVVYLILGAPSKMPITMLTWMLDELADDVIRERLMDLEIENFYGEEEKLFKGIIEDKPDDQIQVSINAGFYSNLYEMKVDDTVKNFKKSIQKLVQKYVVQKSKVKKKKSNSDEFKVVDKFKEQEASNKASASHPNKAFALFPAFDSAEKELRTREFAKEITINIVRESVEEINQEKFIEISQCVLQVIRNMDKVQIIWANKGWVYFKPGSEDLVQDKYGSEVYKQILNWHVIREKLIKKRWGLSGEYELVSNDDIFSIFKKDLFSGVITELDRLFALKRLFVRKVPGGFQTWKRKKGEEEQQIKSLHMLDALVSNPIKRQGMFVFFIKFRVHHWLKKIQGQLLLHGDLLRNIDFLDDILFIFNSRFGLEMPNSLLIEEILTDLQALENEGLIKRYLFEGHAITAIPSKIPENLKDRKSLLLQMVTVIANRYRF